MASLRNVTEVDQLLTHFAESAQRALATGLGEPEEQLRPPLVVLLQALGQLAGVPCFLVGETPLLDEHSRPDFAVVTDSPLPVGFIELKAAGAGVDVTRYKGRNKLQWERLQALPNLLYTDGNNWRFLRRGETMRIIRLVGDMREGRLADTGGHLLPAVREFLGWSPQPPASIGQLVEAVSGLCRLLRDQVLELLSASQALTALASDWRELLFPSATDAEFANGYAQSVTFALLLARAENITFSGAQIGDIARQLGKRHSLMGKALDVLTEGDAADALSSSLSTLIRVCSVIDWSKLADRGGEPWLRLYEDFLAHYDPELRKQSGSYYTPNEVVAAMVRLVDELLKTRLGRPEGFAATDVVTVDPAMGTGTFLLHVIRTVAKRIDEEEGPGAVPGRLRDMMARVIGLEIQVGPYAVAELRILEELRTRHASIPPEHLRLYVADTLDNPYVEQHQLGSAYEPIARSRRNANKVKRDEPVLVVIGNPPYKDKAAGEGGWVEAGVPLMKQAPILQAFLPPKEWGIGKYTKTLYNLYAYFWRWATWKVFEAHTGTREGIVAFITSAGFLAGPGFAAMRRHLRSIADEIWVIDVSPEGHQPPVPTRVFSGVQQPLAITFVVKTGALDSDTPAPVRHLTVHGLREEKFERLTNLTFRDDKWLECPTGWRDPFTPKSKMSWSALPALDDLMPLNLQGIAANRTWPISPSTEVLERRWQRLVTAPKEQRAALLKETPSTGVHSKSKGLPGYDKPVKTIAEENGPMLTPVRYGYRSFDLQWIIPDPRLIHRPRPELWRSRFSGQVYLTEAHAETPRAGTPVTLTAAIPDMHHYRGRGGKVRPLWRSADRSDANLAPGLLHLIEKKLGRGPTPEDLFAYMVALVAHPAYVERFQADMAVPGVRVPISTDMLLFEEATALGRELVWIQTYGERFADPDQGRPEQAPKLPDGRRPKVMVAIPGSEAEMPEEISYDELAQELAVGSGRVGPVPPTTWDYSASVYRVVPRLGSLL